MRERSAVYPKRPAKMAAVQRTCRTVTAAPRKPQAAVLGTSTRPQRAANTLFPPPVVLIPGFLAFGDYWDVGQLRERYSERTFLPTTPGPLSSHHDRACEVFYQLVGGVVDYGDDHSRAHGHARYGRTERDPLFPTWSADAPIDLLGHSIGGQTARVLLHLLRTRAFPSHPLTSCAWVRSLSALTSPLNGDTVLYALGAIPPDAPAAAEMKGRCLEAGALAERTRHTAARERKTGLSAAPSAASPPPQAGPSSFAIGSCECECASGVGPFDSSGPRCCELPECECPEPRPAPPLTIRLFSAGWLLTILVHLLCFVDSRLLRTRVLDLQLDHWRLSWREGAGAVSRLLRALAWRESIGQSADNAAQVPLAKTKTMINCGLGLKIGVGRMLK